MNYFLARIGYLYKRTSQQKRSCARTSICFGVISIIMIHPPMAGAIMYRSEALRKEKSSSKHCQQKNKFGCEELKDQTS
jgi:hypothetical protein